MRRTMPRLSSVRTAGAVTSPPPSQVEGRTNRRTGSRWGLRTLLVGGFAGVAWLLSGAAAHAADLPVPAGTAIGGSSVVSLVDGLGTEAVGRPATDTASSDKDALLAGGTPATGLTAVADRIPADVADQLDPIVARPAHQPSGTPGRALRTITDRISVPVGADAALGAVGGTDGVVQALAAPLRLLDGPADALLDTMDPIRRTGSTRTLLDTAETLATAPDAGLSALSFAPGRTPPPATSALLADGASAELIPVTTGDDAGGSSLIALQRFAAAHLPDSLSATTGISSTPDRPEPVGPLRAHLGAVSGAPAGGSGAPADGGSATVPSAVVAGTVESHRLVAATAVEVRRHDAEAPTVSPD
jgi:hypothetical protein